MRTFELLLTGVLLLAVAGCGYDEGGGPARVTPLLTDSGVRITATAERLWVSTDPLGDVVLGEMQAGDAATAFCFVSDANTNTGAKGTAVQLELGGERGYVAVEIIDPENGEVLRFVDRTSAWLEDRLPACR